MKTILTDLLFWLFFFSSIAFLIIEWDLLTRIPLSWIVIISMIFTIIFFFAKDSIGRRLFYQQKSIRKKWHKTFWGWLVLISSFLTFIVGYNIVQVDLYKLFTKMKNAGGIASGLFDPNITSYKVTKDNLDSLDKTAINDEVLEKIKKIKYKSFFSKKSYKKYLKKLLGKAEYKKNQKIIIENTSKNHKMLFKALAALAESIFLALLATLFAIPFAFVFSFFAARNLMPKTFLGNSIYIFIRTLATFFRSIEAIVWAIIFSVWVGIGPFAGMLALMIHSVAALTKLYSEQIENIDVGPVEAITATGAKTLQIWNFAVVPQILSPFLAFTIYRWDINVRMSTIVGFVGGGGIGLLLQQQQQMLQWQNVGLVIWLIAIVVWIMDMVSAKIREKLLEA
ncbi:MAG: phosphonate ABC transporter, permease protein PhnE [Candidatus Cloacimonetes bacterium]|nr:phosphonate ABC transporter, permease protein PhnE [Candidatus Cloacimonadota bacterium]